jgi:hypothetical protein
MKMKRFASLLALTAGLVMTSGCLVTFLTPKTAALQQIHDTYRADFAALTVPPASAAPDAPSGPSTSAAFSKSLQAIREYRLKYPGDSQELAHLKVLEGMIYIQSGRFGLAEAVRDDVVSAGEKLSSGTGRTVRDQLFARNFKTLINGWSETRKTSGRHWETFQQAADDLAKALNETKAKQFSDPESDQGALYLATTAAIYYVWAFKEFNDYPFARSEIPDGTAPTPEQIEAKKPKIVENKNKWFTAGRDLIGRHLDGSLTNAIVTKDLGQAPEGTLRFVEWYHWLDQHK